MRWCSFTTAVGVPRLGVVRALVGVRADAVLDVGAWARSIGITVPHDVADLVTAAPDVQERVADTVGAAPEDGPWWVDSEDARLLAPLRAPNSLRDFLTFPDHAARGAARRGGPMPAAWERIPLFYKGNRRSVVGPGDEVSWPSYTQKMDFECEVAAVVGRGGRDLGVAEAPAHVFGYTIMNDWSARDIQREEMSCWLGPAKSKDFATSLGPWLVTPDEWSPEEAHLMEVDVDGEVWARGSTAGRRWSFAEMLSWASLDEDLWASDVLGSGTFGGGCGLDLDRWIGPDVVVTLRVEGLGELTNRVVRHPR